MITGVTMRNMAFTRVGSTRSVRVTFQLMIEENGSWRDVTRFSDIFFKYYSSLKENPSDGLGSDWFVQDTQHFTPSNIGNHRTGTPTSQGGSGYWYTYEWNSTPDADHAKTLKAQCTAFCEFPPNDPSHWDDVTRVSERIVSPAEADAQAAAAATPPTPTNPTAVISESKSYITAGCTVPSGSAVKAEVQRSVDGGALVTVTNSYALNSESSVSYRDGSVSAGHRYKYRFRLYNKYGNGGSYSDATSTVDMKPAGITGLKVSRQSIDAESHVGDVKLEWGLLGVTGTKVKVEWSELPDFSGGVSSTDLDYPATVYTAQNLSAAKTWYFRVSSYNANGTSAYATTSCSLTSIPTVTVAPLLAAYKSTDSVTVTWQHASADNAPQTAYHVKAQVGSATPTVYSGTTDTSKTIPLSDIADGTVVKVQVETQSVGGWSGYSDVQQFTVYAPPSVSFSMTDAGGNAVDETHPLASMPLSIETDPATYTAGNQPIWWHLVISAGESYASVSPDGTERYVTEGEVLLDWSITNGDAGFDPTGLHVSIGPGALRFEQFKTYRARVECATAASLRAESRTVGFAAELSASIPRPNAAITWDATAMAADIIPMCAYHDDVEDVTVYVEGVTLAVYRVASDGDVHLVAEGIANDGIGGCRDPHADFGTCTYRIVATDAATGIQAATDRVVDTPFPLSVVLWDEGQLFYNEYGEPKPYMGRALMGMYNNQAGESYAKDTAYREHAGARHPVARRGTQRGHKLSLGFEVVADSGDADLLRDLENYDGDCYVRVPGFPGFPADARVTSIGRSSDTHGMYSASVEFTHVMDDAASAGQSGGVEVVTS